MSGLQRRRMITASRSPAGTRPGGADNKAEVCRIPFGQRDVSSVSGRIGTHQNGTGQQISWTSFPRARNQACLVSAARASTAPVVGAIATSPR
jgi:hypothetical protein